jgi:hypothetical protein
MGSDEGNHLQQSAAKLTRSAGLGDEFTIEPLPRGANNRLFRVETGRRTVLLKAYFHHPSDPRDRLSAEFAFSSFAWGAGLRSLPEPLACDRQNHYGLYEFINGRTLEQEDITSKAVDGAARFFIELNAHRDEPAAKQLSPGSEACFSIGAHFALVKRRVEALSRIEPSSQIDREALAFVRDVLTPAWNKVERHNSLPKLADVDRCLSPSDFGFHNALLSTARRSIVFLDFEYAGWDDPARMVCDFFCQPARPVSMEHFPLFTSAVASSVGDADAFHRRIDILLPVYQIKWCCIMLNDFLPAGALRRRFATGTQNSNDRKKQQLAKAVEFLNCLHS